MMQIGELAERAGVTTRTIRYYEELGIIQPEERSSGGFRLYSDGQMRRLEMVQSLKSLGFDLERIRELFSLKESAGTGGDLARSIIVALEQQQARLDEKIEAYGRMKTANLQAMQILGGCLDCARRLGERDCHQCEVYRRHPVVPEVIECAIYDT
jgi:DNA-binding transcriptional MerR regulator